MNYKKEGFRFEVLTENNKNTWLDIAKKCSYAPVNALDEFFLDEQLENNCADGNAIIYERENNIPIALFPGVVEKRKRGLITLKILRSRFGGLLIDDNYSKDVLVIKNFVFRQIINKYYASKLRIDLVEVELPPKIIIDSPLIAFKIVPFYWSNVEVNSILYLKIDNDILGKLKHTVKR